jgi:hypothetical protein
VILPQSLPTTEEIANRLEVIFPTGIPARHFLVRKMTARTVFTCLYVRAIEGNDRWIAPRYVVRMSDAQAALQADADRTGYYDAMLRSRAPDPAGRWYAENSREPLRDEVIRQGLVPVNAMIERSGVAVTSRFGKYALARDFADLFDPIPAHGFEARAKAWTSKYLSPAALARAALVRNSASTASGNITVSCPGGHAIVMPPGPSPIITKAVVEIFAPTFLANPRVAWISDSASKQPFKDAPLESALQIKLDATALLPDLVLVDLDPPGRQGRILIVFVEVVASDGAVTEQRKAALLNLIASGQRAYGPEDAAFVTAYMDRAADAAKRTIPSLAWGSFAWFVSEPEYLMQLHDRTRTVSSLL